MRVPCLYKLLLFVATMGFAINVPAAAIYQIPEIKGDIDIEKGLSAPAWQKAIQINVEKTAEGAKADPRYLTETHWLFNGESLYVAARCLNPDAPKLFAEKRGRDGHLWEQECLEIFPGDRYGKDGKYLQLVINPNGDIFDHQKGTPFATWNGNLTCAVTREKGAWTAILRIPVSDLKGIWEQGAFMTLNMCRGAFNADGSGEKRIHLAPPAPHNPTEIMFLGAANPALLGDKLEPYMDALQQTRKLVGDVKFNQKVLTKAEKFRDACKKAGEVSPQQFMDLLTTYDNEKKALNSLKSDLIIDYMFAKQAGR